MLDVILLTTSIDGIVGRQILVSIKDDGDIDALADAVAAKLNENTVDISIWKPRIDVTERALRKSDELESQLRQHDFDLARFCDNLTESCLAELVKNVLGATPTRRSEIPLVASYNARVRQQATPTEEDENDETDVLSELQRDFEKSVKIAHEGGTPSQNSKSREYHIRQCNVPILDGRYSDGGGPTVAPPVELYYPGFARFRANVNDHNLPVPEITVQRTAAIMRNASRIATLEKQREHDTREYLSDLIRYALSQNSNIDKTTADHIALKPLSGVLAEVALLLIAEEKAESGWSGDPSVQGPLSYLAHWSDPTRRRLRNLGNCPAFVIGIAGPWLVIMGCIFTSNVIAQRLTGYLWIGHSRVIDDALVFRLSRIFHSLHLAIKELEEYYIRLLSNNLQPPSNNPRPSRFVPSITSYTSAEGPVTFRYLKPLESDKACVTFLAVVEGKCKEGKACDEKEKRVVVKFVERYGEQVHRLLAERRLAPKLLYCGPISNDPALDYGERLMVVMEYIEGKTADQEWSKEPVPDAVRNRLYQVVELLRTLSFVHGDLRKTNFMIEDGLDEPEERIKIIDFDWAGVEGEVRYPLHLSARVYDVYGIEDYQLIKHEHDLAMVAKL